MRKLKLQIQMTIDGFAGGPNGGNDWVFISGKGDQEALQQMIGFGADIAPAGTFGIAPGFDKITKAELDAMSRGNQ